MYLNYTDKKKIKAKLFLRLNPLDPNGLVLNLLQPSERSYFLNILGMWNALRLLLIQS